MSYRNEGVLEKEIAEKLDVLTSRGVVQWKKEGQIYTATHKGMTLVIEDSGQNWLVINKEDGENIDTIMDTASETYVESLLSTI